MKFHVKFLRVTESSENIITHIFLSTDFVLAYNPLHGSSSPNRVYCQAGICRHCVPPAPNLFRSFTSLSSWTTYELTMLIIK
jgi:hypothetical protein